MPEISVPLMGNAGIRAFTPKELPCPRSADFTARFAPALLPWPPRVRRNTFPLIPVVFAFVPSVQLLDFESHCPLLRHASLIYGFLFVRSVVCHGLPSERALRQAPCPSVGGSRCRAPQKSFTASSCAMPDAHQKGEEVFEPPLPFSCRRNRNSRQPHVRTTSGVASSPTDAAGFCE